MMQVFETTDPDVAREVIREQYAALRIRLRGDRFLFRHEQTLIGPARLDRVTYGASLRGTGDPMEALVVCRSRSGAFSSSRGGTEEAYGPGEVFFPVPPGTDITVALADYDGDVLALPPDLLDDVAGADVHAGGRVQLLADRPVTTQLGAQLWRLAATLGAEARDQPEGWSCQLVADATARLLAAAVLTAFPNDAVTDPTIEDRRDAHPATVRRAVAFMESRPDAPISVADIARATYVTPRALQLAFRRHLDTTPMAYLRQVRLDRAHADLQAADPDDSTVTAIANRWGFGNPSRFAADYQRAYGRRPSATLNS